MNHVPALALSLLLAVGGQSKDHGGKLPWKKNLAAGLKDAKQKGAPLAVYFTSEG